MAILLPLGPLACAQGPPAEQPADKHGPVALARAESPGWIQVHAPGRTAPGYNLVSLWQRVPALLDMNGAVVHAWPEARIRSRARLLADGSLLAISLGRGVVELGWRGEGVWEWSDPSRLAHHDLLRLPNGNTLVIVKRRGATSDDVVEIDRAGDIVWEWRAEDHLTAYWRAKATGRRNDRTHINSLDVVPENRHFDAGDERFRPGNLLLSARHLDAIFVVERSSGKVVWIFDRGLDRQHEARMIEPGLPGAGRIQLFDNGYLNRHRYRRSAVLEIEPETGEVVWEYRADGFYSPTGGLQQHLSNGNVLVASSLGGRIFEVTRRGEIVWQWTPPFALGRPRRVPLDRCPQLAALEPAEPVPKAAPPGARYVDPPAYEFVRERGWREAEIDGDARAVLRSNRQCATLFLPRGATVEAAYGLDRGRARADGLGPLTVRFSLTLTEAESGEAVELLSETLGPDGAGWRRREIPLDRHAPRWADLCVTTEDPAAPDRGGLEGYAVWQVPRIRAEGVDWIELPGPTGDLTPEELEARREHLRTMGYVN